MDPLSIIASVVGITTAAVKVSGAITNILRTSRHAPQSIRDIQTEVDTIRITLEQLQAFILRRSAAHQSRASWILVEQIIVVLANSVLTFSELDVFVGSLKSDLTLGVWDRVRWSTKASTADELVNRLQRHKLSLIMMLTIFES